jgi:PAS domain S-box-containing protein
MTALEPSSDPRAFAELPAISARVLSVAIYREHPIAVGSFLAVPSRDWVGTSKASRVLHEKSKGETFPLDGTYQSRLGTISLVVGVGFAYFMAARLGLAVRANTGTSIFWPAAGISVGALIVWGPRARLPVSAGVVLATAVSNLMIGRSTWLAVAFGIVNAGQALLTTGLVERWFGRVFKLGDVSQVLGFLVASTIGAAVAAVGAAIVVSLIQSATSPFIVWRIWFASCLLGIVTVTPLVVGIAEAVRNLPPRREVVEGAVGVMMLAALSAFVVSLPQGPWSTALPVALVFPVLLWIAVRCRPVFAAAAAFVVASAVVWSITMGVGHFGDASVPLADRILAAQTIVLAGALLTLVLAALFADRRRSEVVLEQSKNRLQLAIDGAELGAFSANLMTSQLEYDARAARIHGYKVSPTTIKEARSVVHRDDLVRIDVAMAEAIRTGGTWNAEYRVVHPPNHTNPEETRWVAVEGSIVRDPQGNPVGLLGVTRDITRRKQADAMLEESKARLADALTAGEVMAFEWDAIVGITQRSDNAAHILGLGGGMTATSRNDFLRWVHPDDRVRFRAHIRNLHPGQPSYSLSFRFVRPDRSQIWLEETAKGEFDATGRLLRIKGLTRDITERKLAELALAERNTQLELTSKTARVGSYAIDFRTGLVNLSPGCASILGLPESTIEMPRDNGRKLVHSEDLVHFDASLEQAFLKKQHEFFAQFRIIRADNGEVRWIEARSMIFYDQGGQPLRLIAVIIDFTERKMAEQTLTERTAQLALAGRAARVGSYAYDVKKGVMQISEGYAAIHGLPAGTTETTLCEWRSRVHPDDLRRVEVFRDQMFANRQKEYNIEYRIVRSDGEMRWVERRSSVAYDGDGHPRRVVGVSIDVTERKRAEERQRILVAELDHRVKNALATVSSVISHTAVGSRSVADFVASIDGRIRSMATTQDLLRSGRWDGISLTELIRHELAPYATRQNTKISGPELVLRPEAGQTMAMVLHELTTNAAKYGALSTKEGRVSIRWERRLNGHPLRLVLEWQEVGGPPVVDPDKASFGMSTIRDLIPYEFGGKVDLTFAPEGVRCRVELPADWLRTDESFQRPSHTRP